MWFPSASLIIFKGLVSSVPFFFFLLTQTSLATFSRMSETPLTPEAALAFLMKTFSELHKLNRATGNKSFRLRFFLILMLSSVHNVYLMLLSACPSQQEGWDRTKYCGKWLTLAKCQSRESSKRVSDSHLLPLFLLKLNHHLNILLLQSEAMINMT